MIAPLLLSRSDSKGGAARAAFRLHRALVAAGIESEMWVDHRAKDDHRITGNTTKGGQMLALARPTLDNLVLRLQKPGFVTHRSAGLLSFLSAERVNSSPFDLVHLN